MKLIINSYISLGKKKTDPDFVELPIASKSDVKLELSAVATEAPDDRVNNIESGSEDNLQNESPEVQEEEEVDGDNDWEGCSEVTNFISTSKLCCLACNIALCLSG